MLSDEEVLERLAKLGNGSAGQGFTALCALAFTCPSCLQRYDAGSKCGCSGEAGHG